MQNSTLVIFDCDGTLVDSQHAIVASMAHAYATVGLPCPPREKVLSIVGLSLPECFEVLSAGAGSRDAAGAGRALQDRQRLEDRGAARSRPPLRRGPWPC